MTSFAPFSEMHKKCSCGLVAMSATSGSTSWATMILLVSFSDSGSIGQGFALRLGGQPDQDHAQGVYERHDGAGFGVTAVVKLHQLSLLQGADGGQNAAEVEAQPLPGGAHPRGKQFGKVQGQPAIERGGRGSDDSDGQEK